MDGREPLDFAPCSFGADAKSHKPHSVKSRLAAKFLIYARERGPVGVLGAVIRSAAL
jgi:hypothetical protein